MPPRLKREPDSTQFAGEDTTKEGGSRTLRIDVEAGSGGRLDRFLAERLGISRTRIAALILERHILVDGRPAKKSENVGEGQSVEIEIPPPEPLEVEPEEIPLEVLYEDE
ncbi:S4 domain-containing protein, partial [Gemmatimonadota bacterium]